MDGLGQRCNRQNT